MKIRLCRFICLFLAFIVFLGTSPRVFASRGQSTQVSVSASAKSYCLMDVDTGKILSCDSEKVPMPIASTTKIMTCLVALECAEMNETVKIDPKAVGIEGSSVYLVSGEELKLSDLLYALMLESANDAAVAIAIHVGGSEEAFCSMMNDMAKRVGLVNTHFVNPHGLHHDNHYSTAEDLCMLMSYAMKNASFAEITSTKTKTIPATGGNSRFLSNHNRLLRSFDACIGGKTGYTKTAGRCLVTAAEDNGKTLVCTTLGAPDDWRDHKSLYEYGFSLYVEREVARDGEMTYSLPVVGGVSDACVISNPSSVTLPLLREDAVAITVETPHFLYAPVRAGDYVGDAVVKVNNSERLRIPLYANVEVDAIRVRPGFFQRLWEFIKSWFE